jgi:hypothetical protein
MKSMFTRYLCTLFFASCVSAFCGTAQGAIIIVDSFTQGAFTLQHPSNRSDLHPDPSYAFKSRTAEGTLTRSWTATLNPTLGTFMYATNLVLPPRDIDFFNLNYSAGERPLDLLGYNAFVFEISSLTGKGALQVFVDDPSNSFGPPVAINGTGGLILPFSQILPGGGLESLSSIQIRLYPQSQDFAITLDEIAIIPEPGTLSLAAGAVWWITRRPGRRVLVLPA